MTPDKQKQLQLVVINLVTWGGLIVGCSSTDFKTADLRDPMMLAEKLYKPGDDDSISTLLGTHFTNEMRNGLPPPDFRGPPTDDLKEKLVAELNRQIHNRQLTNEPCFSTNAVFRSILNPLNKSHTNDMSPERINRRLLEEAYTNEIRRVSSPEFEQKLADLNGCPGPPCYFLEFERNGQLANPSELQRAIQDLGKRRDDHASCCNRRTHRFLLLSFGWDHSRKEAIRYYTEFIRDYLRSTYGYPPTNQKGLENWTIFCVAWESKNNTLENTLADILPSPSLPHFIANKPDYIFLPLTFWTKARLADRIGSDDLPRAMKWLLNAVDPRRNQTEIYVVGHSFGCRVLSSFMQQLPRLDKQQLIRGAVLIQPAMTIRDLPDSRDYPTVVTQSRHDRANRFFYPLGNILLNCHMFKTAAHDLSITESLSSQSSSPSPSMPSGPDTMVRSTTRTMLEMPDDLRQSLLNAAPVAWAFLKTLALVPFAYTREQWHQITTRKLEYIPDTLAQVPVVQVPVWLLDKQQSKSYGRSVWAERGKGLFNLGDYNESVAVPFPRELISHRTNWVATNLPVNAKFTLPASNGVIFVDCSQIITKPIWIGKPDMNQPEAELGASWLDLTGSHGEFRKTNIFNMIHTVLNHKSASKDAAER